MAFKILLLQDIFNEGKVYFQEHNCDLYISQGKNEAEIVEEIHKIQPDALCARNNKITAAMMDAASTIKVVAKHGVGYDSIDVAHATVLPFNENVVTPRYYLGVFVVTEP